MNLHILDCSNYIYAGAFSNKSIARGVRESNGTYEANEAPIGGVRFLIRQIASLISDNDEVIPVFDRIPEIKKDMYQQVFGWDGYKANRPPKTIDITGQQRYAEQILRDIGFAVQSVDTYEADDVIYSLVQYFKDDYEHIYIHTKDSDLSFLVSENVSIAMVGDKGKEIDIISYPNVIKKGEYIWYNTCMMHKLYAGDVSDNIPGIGKEFAPLFDAVVPTSDFRKLGDLDLCRQYIKQAITNNPMFPGGHNILRTFNILCPLLIDYEELNDIETDIDANKWAYYVQDWNKQLDTGHLEDMLMEYIESYYI
jgi:hypothetical protein